MAGYITKNSKNYNKELKMTTKNESYPKEKN